MILPVYLDGGQRSEVVEVPVTPHTVAQDVLTCCAAPGETHCHLVAMVGNTEHTLRADEPINEVLRRSANIGQEVNFYLRHYLADELQPPAPPSALYGDPYSMDRMQLEQVARDQLHQISANQVRLANREAELGRVRGSARSEAALVNEERERLKALKKRVDVQENRLQRLRRHGLARRKQQELNDQLDEELSALRSLFNEKERELSLAVARVEQLNQQLGDLKVKVASQQARDGQRSGGQRKEQEAAAERLETLRAELRASQSAQHYHINQAAQTTAQMAEKKARLALLQRRVDEVKARLGIRPIGGGPMRNRPLPGGSAVGTRPNVAAVEPWVHRPHTPQEAVPDWPKEQNRHGPTGESKGPGAPAIFTPKPAVLPMPAYPTKPTLPHPSAAHPPSQESAPRPPDGPRLSAPPLPPRVRPSPTPSLSSTSGIVSPAQLRGSPTLGGPSLSSSDKPTILPKPQLSRGLPPPVEAQPEAVKQQDGLSVGEGQQTALTSQEMAQGALELSPGARAGPSVSQRREMFMQSDQSRGQIKGHSQGQLKGQGQVTGLIQSQGRTKGQIQSEKGTEDTDSVSKSNQSSDSSPSGSPAPIGRLGQAQSRPYSPLVENTRYGPSTNGQTRNSCWPPSPTHQASPQPASPSHQNASMASHNAKPAPVVTAKPFHPRLGNAGSPVPMKKPSNPTMPQYASKQAISSLYLSKMDTASLERYQQGVSKAVIEDAALRSKTLSPAGPTESTLTPTPSVLISAPGLDPEPKGAVPPSAPQMEANQSVGHGQDEAQGSSPREEDGTVGGQKADEAPVSSDDDDEGGSYVVNVSPSRRRKVVNVSQSASSSRASDSKQSTSLSLHATPTSTPTPTPTPTLVVPRVSPTVLPAATVDPKEAPPTISPQSEEQEREQDKANSGPKKILKKGSRLGKKHNRNVTFDPLSLLLDASLEGEVHLVKQTAHQVEDPSVANDEGITALHNSICAGHLDIVIFLVEFGCNVNAQDSDGWTPLHCAASCNNLPMAQCLVQHGAAILATTLSDQETSAEKCEESEEGFAGCSQYLYGAEKDLGTINGGLVYALWDYAGEKEDELTITCGQALVIIRRGDSTECDWWWAQEAPPTGQSTTNGKLSLKEGYVAKNLLGLTPRVERTMPTLTNGSTPSVPS